MRAFSREHLGRARESTQASLIVVSCRSDATNSAVWHSAKIHATEVRVGYILDLEALAVDPADKSLVASAGSFADLQKVTDQTAAGLGFGTQSACELSALRGWSTGLPKTHPPGVCGL